MKSLNCWEAKECGRQPGGAKVAELGVCPASIARVADGINGGQNGGRACWAIAGTLCGGQVQGVFAAKFMNCMTCEFYQQVHREQGANFVQAKEILARLGEASVHSGGSGI